MRHLTREATRVVVMPLERESHRQGLHVTYAATIALHDDDEPHVLCPHNRGHRTTSAAVACGMRMWRQLPESN